MTKLVDVLAALGDSAQEGGGRVVVLEGGKHVEVGATGADGEFIFTPRGEEIFNETSTVEGVTVISGKKGGKGVGKGGKKPEAVVEDVVEETVVDAELPEDLESALSGLELPEG